MTLSRRTCFAHPDLWKIKTGIQDRKGSLGKAFFRRARRVFPEIPDGFQENGIQSSGKVMS